MRKSFEVQLALGSAPIENVEIPTKTRDELPPTLAALEWIFRTPEVSKEVFKLLEQEITSHRKATRMTRNGSLADSSARCGSPDPRCEL